jgi:hypothetical protein
VVSAPATARGALWCATEPTETMHGALAMLEGGGPSRGYLSYGHVCLARVGSVTRDMRGCERGHMLPLPNKKAVQGGARAQATPIAGHDAVLPCAPVQRLAAEYIHSSSAANECARVRDCCRRRVDRRASNMGLREWSDEQCLRSSEPVWWQRAFCQQERDGR